MGSRIKILFVSEAATLAHVIRPLVLARTLPTDEFEITFAGGSSFPFVFRSGEFRQLPLASRSPAEFASILKKGGIIFDRSILHRYVKEELQIIAAEKPDVIVGDLRPSLAVSTRIANIPLITLTNAYWSPYARSLPRFPIPVTGLTENLGRLGKFGHQAIHAFEAASQRLLPKILKAQSAGIDQVCEDYGYTKFTDYLTGFTFGDVTLFADVPSIVPTTDLPPSCRYVGPLNWAPEVSLPAWWDSIPKRRTVVYVALGSSGNYRILPAVLSALQKIDCAIVVSSAGKREIGSLNTGSNLGRAQLFVADWLPGDQIARRASLVVSNGGSPTSYQALSAGTPVLGISSNMDQLLSMTWTSMAGAGELLRSDTATVKSIEQAAWRLLGDPDYRLASKRVADEIQTFQPKEILLRTIAELLQGRKSDERLSAVSPLR